MPVNRLCSEDELEYSLAGSKSQRTVMIRRFRFTSPIWRNEQDDLHWYLEKYYLVSLKKRLSNGFLWGGIGA